MSECTCSFRGKERGKFICRIDITPSEHGRYFHICHPDTCTLWQDHLRIDALEQAISSLVYANMNIGVDLATGTKSSEEYSVIPESPKHPDVYIQKAKDLNQLLNRHNICPVCGVDKNVCKHIKIGG